MADSLHAILMRSEREPAVFQADQVSAWPEGDLEAWGAVGVLRPMPPAGSLPCPGCEHVGDIVYLNNASAEACAYVTCPRCGPSPVCRTDLRRWRVDVERLAEFVLAAIVTVPKLTVVVAGRLWRVGQSTGYSADVPVFFARQLHRKDTAAMLERARLPARAVLFAPFHLIGETDVDSGLLIMPLTTVASYSAGTIQLDHDQIRERLAEWPARQAGAKARRPVRKRSSRAAEIAVLTREMQDHLRAARDYAVCTRDHTGESQLLPRPTQGELAHRIGASQWTVSRCLHDSEARELKYLWQLSVDLDRILDYRHS